MSQNTAARVVSLCRYPVKGFGPEMLDEVTLTPGETIPFDRAWAIENGPGRFDPENPQTLPKINFLMLMRNARLAALGCEFDDATRTFTLYRDGHQMVKGALETQIGRNLIEQFIAGYMPGDLRGAPHIVHAPGHSFSDVADKCLHVVNLASVRELERNVSKAVDPLRFRANVYVDMGEPWVEFDWVDKSIGLGATRLDVIARTDRCAATEVDPQTGERDLGIPAALQRVWGHQDFGLYARVVEGGTLCVGDAVAAP